MKQILAVLLIVPSLVWAQTTPSPTGDASANAAASVEDSSLRPFDSPCAYPPSALSAGSQGVTHLAFQVAEDGNISNVTVEASSGDANLDQAAASCVSHWRSRSGNRVGPNHTWIAWSIPKDISASNPAIGKSIGVPHSCDNYYPPRFRHDRVTGTTRVRFQITETGMVESPEIAKSSGNVVLDAAALYCVRSWHYRPALQNAKPVATTWEADIVWNPPDQTPQDPGH